MIIFLIHRKSSPKIKTKLYDYFLAGAMFRKNSRKLFQIENIFPVK